ncbi:hypothetical protein LV779_19045 [Streptomyces thinghirensis]|nr:hypothetical protein [Streptomyces thinghirensis]
MTTRRLRPLARRLKGTTGAHAGGARGRAAGGGCGGGGIEIDDDFDLDTASDEDLFDLIDSELGGS